MREHKIAQRTNWNSRFFLGSDQLINFIVQNENTTIHRSMYFTLKSSFHDNYISKKVSLALGCCYCLTVFYLANSQFRDVLPHIITGRIGSISFT